MPSSYTVIAYSAHRLNEQAAAVYGDGIQVRRSGKKLTNVVKNRPDRLSTIPKNENSQK